jgi:hypothetical protein
MDTLKKASHEAVAPYFAGAYNTLLSIVQGIALGALVYHFYNPANFSFFPIIKHVIVLFVICTIWHRYVTHSQFVFWRLSFLDTIIPFLFAPFQYWLILAINQSLTIFSGAFLSVLILGFIAYRNSFRKFTKHPTKEMLIKHFAAPEFGEDFHAVLCLFQKDAMFHMM